MRARRQVCVCCFVYHRQLTVEWLLAAECRVVRGSKNSSPHPPTRRPACHAAMPVFKTPCHALIIIVVVVWQFHCRTLMGFWERSLTTTWREQSRAERAKGRRLQCGIPVHCTGRHQHVAPLPPARFHMGAPLCFFLMTLQVHGAGWHLGRRAHAARGLRGAGGPGQRRHLWSVARHGTLLQCAAGRSVPCAALHAARWGLPHVSVLRAARLLRSSS